ncbi:UNVERIFIED_CONTAM: hypothetical protein Scaly_1061200 [Sesamum calycinum]|uniref:Retrotransposon gag domain-containing protein n=1 Tax=Sesamum calycinum TaxID=2727403 RepID=A0AAW2QM82_9LAMI
MKKLHDSIVYHDTSSGMWKELEERFSQGSGPKTQEIKREIANTRQGHMTISVYYAKMKSLWEQLSGFSKPHKIGCSGCTCGVTAKENKEERLHQFVMGLNDSYRVAKSNILCKNPLPSLSNAYSLLTSEEVTLRRHLIEPVGFKVNNDGHRGKTQNKSEKKGKSVAHATAAEIKENDLAQGQSHQQPIHPASLSQEQFDQLLSLLARKKQATPTVNFIGNLAKAKEKPGQWILGSGASDHIISDATLLMKDTNLEKSIKDLTTKRVIGKGKLKGDLYYFESEDEAKIHVAKTNMRMEILHQRLGHIPNKRLRSIFRDTTLDDNRESRPCDACHKAKQCQNIFPVRDNKSKNDANQENLTNIKSSIGVPLDDAGIDEEFTYEEDQDAKTESELDIETIE